MHIHRTKESHNKGHKLIHSVYVWQSLEQMEIDPYSRVYSIVDIMRPTTEAHQSNYV